MRHLFLCADENYVVPLAVTLKSLAESQTSHESLQVTVLSLGIGPRDQERLRVSASPLMLEFISVEETVPADLPQVRYLSRAAYARLSGVDFLPSDVSRAVYLDCDLLVRADLSYLYSFDLAGHPIAAVQDQGIPQVSNPWGLRMWRNLGLSPTTPYMNSGVLVIDTEAWRARDLGTSILEFVAEHRKELSLADQDGFNAVLAGDFAPLPLRWNQQTVLREPNHLGYSFHSQLDVDEAIMDPAIIHFTGPKKPWHRSCADPSTSDWLELLQKTEFRDYEAPRPTRRARASYLWKTLRRA